MGKHDAVSLLRRGDETRALKISAGKGETPYQLDWSETLPPTGATETSRWQELARGKGGIALLLANESCLLQQTLLPPLKHHETEKALLGLVVKQRGAGQGGWLMDFRQHREAEESAGGPRRAYLSLFTEREAVEERVAELENEGLRPRLALPTALALDALLRHHGPDPELEAWNLVFLGEEERFLCVGDGDGPIFVRSLPEDLSHGEDRDEYLSRLVTEIQRSNYFAQQGENPLIVGGIVLCGDPDLTAPLAQLLNEKEGPPVQDWRAEALFAKDEGVADWREVLALAGAAAVLLPRGFNLLPRRPEDHPFWRIRRYSWRAGATLAIAALPILLGASLWTRSVQERTLVQQSRQLDEATAMARQSAELYLKQRLLLNRQESLDLHDNGRLGLAEVLLAIAQRRPESVHLLGLNLVRSADGAYQLQVEGECLAPSSAAAQRGFQRFHDALLSYSRLGGSQEPRYLEITEQRQGQENLPCVAFKLDFEILEGGGP